MNFEPELILATYISLLTPHKQNIFFRKISNADYWEFMRQYSTWPMVGLKVYDRTDGLFKFIQNININVLKNI